MKCVIILATFFALHIHASNELIDYKSQRIVNLYNKAIDYVIADLEISERDMYIDKELGGLCYPRFPRFSNDSIVNVLWEDEYENNGCGIKNIHFLNSSEGQTIEKIPNTFWYFHRFDMAYLMLKSQESGGTQM